MVKLSADGYASEGKRRGERKQTIFERGRDRKKKEAIQQETRRERNGEKAF